jgi:hypothetical protein
VLSLVIQTFLGIEAALVESAEVAIFTRSLLQGLRGLATA